MDDTRRVAAGLLELFDGHRAAAPAAAAVVDDAGRRTYGQLHAEAGTYASALQATGAGPESVVAVVARRSAHYVAMLLGVHLTGAAFLPLDPVTPAPRARRMCADAGVRALLVQPGLEADAARLTGDGAPDGPSVVPAVAAAGTGGQAVTRSDRHPDGLAYVIFTSGSTGTPKGAMVTNGGMDNHVAAKTLDLGLTRRDVVGFTAPLSFDISVWQALTALTVGGAVAVASPANLSEPLELLAWVRRHRVTILEIVPSFMTVLVEVLEQDPGLRACLGSLRYLVATGEALPGALARRWYACCPGIPVVNAYGPTECSDDVTHRVVTPEEAAASAWPPIGREILNTRVYVVDPAGREVPPGVEGDLLVGGSGVGRGYIGDPSRTAMSFVPDHLSGQPGARLYRTGDRGTRAGDGTISYVGRRDRQVKVRGHRVELGDVEAQLLAVPTVASAACVFSAGRLHAFVTLRGGAGSESASRRVIDAVRASAPHYLVPHGVTVLEEMPTGRAGKIDHEALRQRLAGPTAAPTADAAESMLDAVCATAAEVLGLPGIGPDDDFFAAGGDSLALMTLLAVARKRFDAERADMRGFLAAATPRGLLAVLEAARRAPAVPAAATAPAPAGALSSGQERLWFLERLHPRKGAQLIRFGLSLHGALDHQALQHALDAAVARHEPLRSTFAEDRGVPRVRVWPEARAPIQVVTTGREDLATGLSDNSGLSARTETPPLMVPRLTRIAADHHVLTLLMHHLVADGFSLGVLADEIGTYYQRYVDRDRDVPLPEATFSQYVAEERRWLEGPEAREHERYWTTLLDGAPPRIDLPLDRPRPARAAFTADAVVRELSADETARVATIARAMKASPFMAVLAAFYAVLRDVTGSRDLVLGIDSANRSWPGSEQLVGTFVNQLPVRLNAPAGAGFGTLLDAVRARCLEAYEHERLPFHKIVAAVNPPRQGGLFPLFQVKVTHQGAWQGGLHLPDIAVIPEVLTEPATDLDLLLDVSGEHDRLRLELLFRPELLDHDTAAAWVEETAGVLRAGPLDPDTAVAPAAAGAVRVREV